MFYIIILNIYIIIKNLKLFKNLNFYVYKYLNIKHTFSGLFEINKDYNGLLNIK